MEIARTRKQSLADQEAALDAWMAPIAEWIRPGAGRTTRRRVDDELGKLQPLVDRLWQDARARQAEILAQRRLGRPMLNLLQERQGLRNVIWRCQKMPALRQLVDRALSGHREPLMPNGSLPDVTGPQEMVYLAMHAALTPDPGGRGPEMDRSHRDIVLPLRLFFDIALAASRVSMARGRPGPLRFVDVGCGAGSKLVAAAQIFDRVEGIELDPRSVEVARGLLGAMPQTNWALHHADALAFDGYAEFDVIYFYEPIHDRQTQIALETKICDMVPDGTLLLIPFHQFYERAARYPIEAVAPCVYIKGLTEQEAARLRRRAERIGTDIRPPDGRLAEQERLGWLTAPALACRDMGHLLTRPGRH